MFSIDDYTYELIASLKAAFSDRLIYVGLQGGFRRGEINADSDIDIMAVIDHIERTDLDTYRSAVAAVNKGSEHQSCGFICGRDELAHWNPLELCQVTHETLDKYGKLAELVPSYTANDVRSYIKFMAGNLSHELCHRYIYRGTERSAEMLPAAYRQTFYILQNLYWLRTGDYILTKRELLDHLTGEDKKVLQAAIEYKSGNERDFESDFDLLLNWCGKVITTA